MESGFFPWNKAEKRKEQTRRDSFLQDTFSKTEKGLSGKLHDINKEIAAIVPSQARPSDINAHN